MNLRPASEAYQLVIKNKTKESSRDELLSESISKVQEYVQDKIEKAILAKELSIEVDISEPLERYIYLDISTELIRSIDHWLKDAKYKISHPAWCDHFDELCHMKISWNQ